MKSRSEITKYHGCRFIWNKDENFAKIQIRRKSISRKTQRIFLNSQSAISVTQEMNQLHFS